MVMRALLSMHDECVVRHRDSRFNKLSDGQGPVAAVNM